MTLPTLDSTLTGPELITENTETLVNLEANELTKTLAAPFVLLQDDLMVSLSEENKLLLAIARAEARARRLDAQIDALVDAVKYALLAITKREHHRRRIHPLFQEQTARGGEGVLLADELVTVGAWLPSLAASKHVSLQDIGAKLTPLIQAGLPAMGEMTAANQALVDFYEVGARFELVQRMNSERKATHGKLGQLVHDNPGLGLATTFPDTFYLHNTRRRKKVTPESLDADIAALKKRIAALEIKRDKLAEILAAEQKATKKKNSERRAKEIAKAQQAQAEAAAKLVALEAEEAGGE